MSNAVKTTGNGGIALIKQYEGLRLTTYKDAVGIPTIGYTMSKTRSPGRHANHHRGNRGTDPS